MPVSNDFWYPTSFSFWDEAEHEAIRRVVDSGQFTAAGEVEAFEAEFAAWHGMKHGIMVNSGSSANLVAVAALFAKAENPLRRGHEAIVPAMAWNTTFSPLVQHGLGLRILDIDDTWNAPPIFLAPLNVSCSILGNPDRINKDTDDRLEGYLIEDCCESLGARIGGELCGTRGLMNTFSFFYSHQLSAIEGGMVLTNDDECARICRMLRDHGMTRSVAKAERFEDEYDFRLMGYNLRPLEMHAAIAREQLKKLPAFIKARQANRRYFIARCKQRGVPVTFQRENGEQSPFGIAFACESNEARSKLVAALRRDGIDCRLPCGGSFRKHAYGAAWADQATPRADRIHDTALFIGCPPVEAYHKLERVIDTMWRALCEH